MDNKTLLILLAVLLLGVLAVILLETSEERSFKEAVDTQNSQIMGISANTAFN